MCIEETIDLSYTSLFHSQMWCTLTFKILTHQKLISKLQIPRKKIVGLAKFFLSIGVPGNARDLFHQIDSLSYLENNRQVE